MDPLDHASSRRILCPYGRYLKDEDPNLITVDGQIHHIISSSYLCVDAKDLKSNHLHSLLSENVLYEDCWACGGTILDKRYFCNYCGDSYHKECVESPSLFHSSDHPKHPLRLLMSLEIQLSNQRQCCSCRNNSGRLFYYCSICDFTIHPRCAINPTPLTIDHHKRHEHTLFYFPRRSALVCDVCGLDDIDYLYVCFLCDFTVHKRCIYLPYVIKVSRHNHRLAFSTPHHNTSCEEWNDCGVCHAKINRNYGKYSCMKGCGYALHPRCAMRRDVCDGKELEGEPEEAYENIKMFVEEGDGLIRHVSHPSHQMQLDKKIQGVYDDENTICQACTLPFYDDDNVYQCMQCDFILHESCAYLSRGKQCMLDVHPLILHHADTPSWFRCSKCNRYSSGFRYVCGLGKCRLVLDILCASICEPFDYHSHPHPLFMTFNEYTRKECSICRSLSVQPLNCVKCNFILCFHCATLPNKVRYKHDEHLLYFSYKEDASDKVYWCEICEEDINPENGMYACNECRITLHTNCLLGRDPYIKIGRINMGYGLIDVLSNTSFTQPMCKGCKRRCRYKTKIYTPFKGLFCSFYCYIQESDNKISLVGKILEGEKYKKRKWDSNMRLKGFTSGF